MAISSTDMSEASTRYRMLVDRTVTVQDSPLLGLPDGIALLDAAAALEALFQAEPTLERVTLMVGGVAVGATSRSYLTRLGARGHRGFGDGDGATLPGESPRYRALRYGCTTCDTVVYLVHVDSSGAPSCPRGHGPMLETR
jgi:hypothetical protein